MKPDKRTAFVWKVIQSEEYKNDYLEAQKRAKEFNENYILKKNLVKTIEDFEERLIKKLKTVRVENLKDIEQYQTEVSSEYKFYIVVKIDKQIDSKTLILSRIAAKVKY